jgi:hypothetical protein
LPHTRYVVRGVAKSQIIFGRHPDGIDYGAPDWRACAPVLFARLAGCFSSTCKFSRGFHACCETRRWSSN